MLAVEQKAQVAFQMIESRARRRWVVQRLGNDDAALHHDLKLHGEAFGGDARYRMSGQRLRQMRLNMGSTRAQALLGRRPDGGVGLLGFLHRGARDAGKLGQRHRKEATP
jgi:hypothetical protein